MGRCRALVGDEKERRSSQVTALREQAIDVVAELGADLLDVTGDFLHGKLQGLRSTLCVKAAQGSRLMWKSQIDKLPPAQYFTDLIQHLRNLYPGAAINAGLRGHARHLGRGVAKRAECAGHR